MRVVQRMRGPNVYNLENRQSKIILKNTVSEHMYYEKRWLKPSRQLVPGWGRGGPEVGGGCEDLAGVDLREVQLRLIVGAALASDDALEDDLDRGRGVVELHVSIEGTGVET